ncbi:hypothetical protein BMS3Bbin03_00825 [bacterium BMS3Bbin03]|nr:hypothetical protein BMS3Bbin03_00825 [bacterium BMS3Bbin03]
MGKGTTIFYSLDILEKKFINRQEIVTSQTKQNKRNKKDSPRFHSEWIVFRELKLTAITCAVKFLC